MIATDAIKTMQNAVGSWFHCGMPTARQTPAVNQNSCHKLD